MWKKFVAPAAAVAMTATALGAAAAPAANANLIGGLSVYLSPDPGVVGQNATLSASIVIPDVIAAGGDVTFASQDWSKTVAMDPGAGIVTLDVMPTVAGDHDIEVSLTPDIPDASDFTTSFTYTVDKAVTRSGITGPDTANVGDTITVLASVASDGAVSATGEIALLADNQQVTKGTIDSFGNATLKWKVPATSSQAIMLATNYLGDAGHDSSTSQELELEIVQEKETVKLSAPSTIALRGSTTLTAIVSPVTAKGEVVFTANGAPIGSPAPVNAGRATTRWTPDKAGDYTLEAKFTDSAGRSVSDTAKSTVKSSTIADTITVRSGNATWSTRGTQTITPGKDLNLSISTRSGATPQVTVTGPCSVSGSFVVSAQGDSGSCTLQVKSPGNDMYSPASESYRLEISSSSSSSSRDTSTTERLPAPPTSNRPTSSAPTAQKAVFHRNLPKKVKAGKTALLSAKSLETNAGEKVLWRVVSGEDYCQVKGKKMPDIAAWKVEKQKAKKDPSVKVTKKKDLEKVPSWVVTSTKDAFDGTKKKTRKCVVEAYTAKTPSGYEDYSKKRTIKVRR